MAFAQSKCFFQIMLVCLVASNFRNAHAKLIKDIGSTTIDEVNFEIAEDLAGHIPAQRVAGMEAVLGSVYQTLPKNKMGRIGHQAVRYALHRLFVKRHGWYIKGLEPTRVAAAISENAWIPSYLQEKLEQHVGKNGMDLHELASLGAALEDLIRKEAGKRMADVYEVLQLSKTTPVGMKMAIEALDTYAMAYLLSGKTKNISITAPRDTERKLKIFANKYKNYTEFHSWFQALQMQEHLNIFSESETATFDQMVHVAEDFGQKYGSFNDNECRLLKAALTAVEGKGRGVGRVRLSDFYNMSRYSHWKLNEKVEYLRDLGALDETNASNPLVIVPNYVTSRPNCLEATPLYAVCCRDECEDLIGRLERDLKQPKASANQITDLIATYSSDTVVAPRQLSNTLIGHLEDIARLHGGEVDVHSRLFAQWMHHAFPRECAYPHESGATNPQTADEWIKANGHDSEQASEEDVQKVLDDAGSCHTPTDGELPWNPNEEVMDGQALETATNGVLACFVLTTGLWGVLLVWYLGSKPSLGKQHYKIKALGFVSVSCLAAGAVAIDIVDKHVVIVVFIIGVGLNVTKSFVTKGEANSSKGTVSQGKCV